MKVFAKYQLAYNNELYLFGQEIEMKQEDYEAYKNDVYTVEEWEELQKINFKEVKEEENKLLKKSKVIKK